MMKLLLLHCVIFFILLSAPVSAGEWLEVAPGNTVDLPGHIFFQKDYRLQWWYFTGHLFDGQGREFGYELTFFGAGVQKRKFRSEFGINTIYLSHFAVTDIQNNRFYHFSRADAGAYGFAGAERNRLKVWVGKDSVEGTLKKMHITAQAKDVELSLVLVPRKPAVLNGEKGYSRKSEESPLIASLYFSMTHMATEGILKMGDQEFQLTGKSWFDREITSRGLSKDQGWDWFALQFDDGREIMLYQIRKKEGSVDEFSSGTYIDKNGSYHEIKKKDYSVKVLNSYTSKHTGIRYPSKWEITIPSKEMKLVVTPLMEDQEFTGIDIMRNTYWEGACGIEGSARGRAYVEMTGYK